MKLILTCLITLLLMQTKCYSQLTKLWTNYYVSPDSLTEVHIGGSVGDRFGNIYRTGVEYTDSSLFIEKINHQGDLIWRTYYNHPGNVVTSASPTLIINANDENLIIAGTCYKFSDSDIFLLKVDTYGNKVSEHIIRKPGYDILKYGSTDSSKNLFLVCTNVNQSGDIHTIYKFDFQLNQMIFLEEQETNLSFEIGIKPIKDNTYYLFKSFYSQPNILSKYSNDSLVWTISDGNFLVGINKKIFSFKNLNLKIYDSNAAYITTKSLSFLGNVQIMTIIDNSKGELFFAGTKEINGGNNGFIAKLDTSYNLEWMYIHEESPINYSIGYQIVISENDDIYGLFLKRSSPSVFYYPNVLQLVHLSDSGILLDSISHQEPSGSIGGISMVFHKSTIKVSCSIEPGTDYVFTVGFSCDDCSNVTSIKNETPKDSQNKLSVFPNPFTDIITLNTGTKEYKVIEIYDTQGRLHFKTDTNSDQMNINTEGFSSGLYIVKMITEGRVVQVKIVKAEY